MSKFMKNLQKAMILVTLSQNPTMIRFMSANEIHTFLDNDKE